MTKTTELELIKVLKQIAKSINNINDLLIKQENRTQELINGTWKQNKENK